MHSKQCIALNLTSPRADFMRKEAGILHKGKPCSYLVKCWLGLILFDKVNKDICIERKHEDQHT